MRRLRLAAIRARMARAVLALSALLLATAPLFAQKPHLRFYAASHSGTPEGSYFRTLFQDRHGILWFGSQRGLYRFDGYRCRKQELDAEHSGLRILDDITCMLEDSRGGFWVCTGLGVYRRGPQSSSFEPVFRNRHMAGPERIRIFAAARDRHGDLWFAAPEHLFQWKNRTGAWATVSTTGGRGELPADARLCSMIAGRDGSLWIGTVEHGLFRMDPETRQVTACPMSAVTGGRTGLEVRALASDRQGRLWLATDRGLVCYGVADRRARLVTEQPDRDKFTTVMVDRGDNVWVGSLHGSVLLRRNKKETIYTYHPVAAQPGGALRERVYTIFEDRLGVIWIGHQSGILYFDGRLDAFAHFRHDPFDPHTVPCPNISRYYEDQRGTIWIASVDDGLFERRPGAKDFFHHRLPGPDPKEPIPLQRIYALEEDRRGRIWIGTFENGLHRFDPVQRRFKTYRHDPADPRALPHDTVSALHVDQRGRLWIGTADGVARYDPDQDDFEVFRICKTFSDQKSPNAVCMNALAESPDGTIWVGLTMYGLLRFSPDGRRIRHYHHDPDRSSWLSNNQVQTVFVARNGMVWLKTGEGGLERLNPDTETFYRYPDNYDRTRGRPAAIMEDADDVLWVTYRHGLLEFNPDTGEFVNHARTLSLPLIHFLRGAVGRGSDGTIYLADRWGMSAFNPARFRKAQGRPELILTGIEVLGRPFPSARPWHDVNQTTLSYEQRLITISFAVTDYACPWTNTYRYQLEGVDPDWVQAGNEPRATYANLKPGAYTFRAQGAGHDGIWSPNVLTLQVVVKPAYWHSWWFRLAAACAVVGLLALIAIWRHRSTEAHRQEVQLLESQIRHVQKLESLGVLAGGFAHDFNNLLTGILANASYTQRRIRTDSPLSRPLREIEDAARRAEELTGQMLAYAGKGEVTTTAINLSDRVREAASLLKASIAKNATLVFRLAADLEPIQGDPGQIQQVIMNLITNASDALEGSPGTIELETDVKDFQQDDIKGAVLGHDFQAGRYVFLRVTDQGTGMDQETLNRIFDPFFTTRFTGRGLGLAAVLGILHKHGAAIHIQTEPGQGSIFTVLFPCTASPPAVDEVSTLPTRAATPVEPAPPIPEDPDARLRESRPTRPAVDETFPPVSVLVVDDEPLIRFAASSALEEGGMSVVSAPDGETALRHLDAGDVRFDAVVLDLTMPGLSGAEIHSAIRQRRPDLPVVLVSGYSEVEAAPLLNSGPTTFLKKPFTSDTLILHVQEALRRTKSLRDSG